MTHPGLYALLGKREIFDQDHLKVPEWHSPKMARELREFATQIRATETAFFRVPNSRAFDSNVATGRTSIT